MANIKSQKKRIKTNEKARQRNMSFKSKVRTAIKKVEADVKANAKEKAISFLCSKMTEFGIVSDGFYESVIERERLSSTCFFNSFAIPHALIMNAKETMLAILINRKSIQWDDNNIKLVILIAVKKGGVSEFSKVYEHLAKVLCSPVYLSNLIQCNTYSEVLQAIKFVK